MSSLEFFAFLHLQHTFNHLIFDVFWHALNDSMIGVERMVDSSMARHLNYLDSNFISKRIYAFKFPKHYWLIELL